MANKPMTQEVMQRAVDAVHVHGSISAAAAAIGVARQTLQSQYHRAINAGFKPSEWLPESVITEEDTDPIVERRLRDQLQATRLRLADAERRAADAEDWRSEIMRLTAVPPRPQSIPVKDLGKYNGRSIFLALSDWHLGEVVNYDEMDGLNCYNEEIAKHRLARMFSIVSDLATNYWVGDGPDEIVVWIGGDLISGALHPELVSTDDLTIPESVKQGGEHIAGGLLKLWKMTSIPIRVYDSPGNHGRATQKPQSKLVLRNSYDSLVLDFAEMALRHTDTDIRFYRSSSIDCVVPIYNWRFLCTHGDRMGTGGGRGFVGAAAPITRGHKSILNEYTKFAKPPHFIVTGHFHTTMRSPFGWSNGSIIGYSEYAHGLRLGAEGARQTMLVVERDRGVIAEHDLFLGHPDEGTLYQGAVT